MFVFRGSLYAAHPVWGKRGLLRVISQVRKDEFQVQSGTTTAQQRVISG